MLDDRTMIENLQEYKLFMEEVLILEITAREWFLMLTVRLPIVVLKKLILVRQHQELFCLMLMMQIEWYLPVTVKVIPLVVSTKTLE